MKTYIGDGIYAELNEQGLILTTEDGIFVNNRIVFEPREWQTLQEWLKDPRDWNKPDERSEMARFYGFPTEV